MISENIQLLPDSGGESARITIASDYAVINGNHIRISNGYMHNTSGSVSIATKDILSIEKQTLRNKRMLVVGLSLFGIMLLLNFIFWQIGRMIILQTAADIAAGNPSQYSWFYVLRYGTLAILLISSALCVGTYAIRPVHLLRVKALGADLAVEVKHYNYEDINSFIQMYYKPVGKSGDVNNNCVSFCTRCGNQVNQGEAFCAKCGKPTGA